MNKKISFFILFFLLNYKNLLSNDEYNYIGINFFTAQYFFKIIFILLFITLLSTIIIFILNKKIFKNFTNNNEYLKINKIKTLYEDKRIVDFVIDNNKYIVILSKNYCQILDKIKLYNKGKSGK